MTTRHELQVGDRVCGGEAGTDDYDEGRVDVIRDGHATVSWDSLVVTTQPIDGLRLIVEEV